MFNHYIHVHEHLGVIVETDQKRWYVYTCIGQGLGGFYIYLQCIILSMWCCNILRVVFLSPTCMSASVQRRQ